MTPGVPSTGAASRATVALISIALGAGLLFAGYQLGRASSAAPVLPVSAVVPEARGVERTNEPVVADTGTRVVVPQAVPDSRAARPEPTGRDVEASRREWRPGDARDRAANVDERMDRMLRLRRGEDPAERLALAREILADGETGPLTFQALQTLAELDPAAAAGEIRRRLEQATDESRDRGTMAMVIGMLGPNESAVSAADLTEFYESGDTDVQLAAARALQSRGDDSLTLRFQEQCVDQLASADPAVRAAALRQMAGTRDANTVSLVLPLLADPDEQVRLQALRSIGQSAATAEVLAEIRGLADDPSERVRRSAERMLLGMERRLELRQH